MKPKPVWTTISGRGIWLRSVGNVEAARLIPLSCEDDALVEIAALPLISTEGVLREAVVLAGRKLYLTCSWPAIVRSRHKLVWTGYNDLSIEDMKDTPLITLDLATMRFSYQTTNDAGFIRDHAGEFWKDRYFGHNPMNDLQLSNCGTRCIWTLGESKARYYEGDPLRVVLRVTLRWGDDGWHVESAHTRPADEPVSQLAFEEEAIPHPDAALPDIVAYEKEAGAGAVPVESLSRKDKARVKMIAAFVRQYQESD